MPNASGIAEGLRRRALWVLVGSGFVLLVIYLSVTPQPLNVPKWHALNVGHMMAYAWLMFWFSQIYRKPLPRVGIAVGFLALGIGLEYVQAMIGRDFAYTDMRDDGIGIAIGALLAQTPLGRSLALIERWLGA